MDRKTIIGFVLLAALATFWMTYNSAQKAKEEAWKKHTADSIERIDSVAQAKEDSARKATPDTTAQVGGNDSTKHVNSDSLKTVALAARYGNFTNAMKGDSSPVVIQNEKVKVTIFPRGGHIGRVELKGLKTWDGKPLILFRNDSTRFSLSFFDNKRRRITTDSLYFHVEDKGFSVAGNDSNSVRLRLYADSIGSNRYVEYLYSLRGNSYIVGCTITYNGFDKILAPDQSSVDLDWFMRAPSQEQSLKNQRMYSTVYVRFDGEDNMEDLSTHSTEKKTFSTGNVKWVSFKQQYFCASLIAGTKFVNGATASVGIPADSSFVKDMGAEVSIPFDKTAKETFPMRFYFGPSQYSILKQYNIGLERQINLGSSIFGWLNRFAFVPLFNFLGGFISNYGIVILIMTFIVKIVLLPVSYKSFMSSAKMRVLKPELDEINKKFTKEEALKKQQATMALYKKAGVSPAAGCIPMLFQLPILFALIRLFPSAFELRQQSFLWAKDLSSYDSIYNFHFNIPWYGDHISLFALLMTGSTLLYTWMNQQILAPPSTGGQLPGMKWMMYLMPVFFLGFLNSYCAALSYYYFVSNMINFGQMTLMRKFINEDAIRAKVEERKKRPVKSSGFLQRLEQAQKKRMQELQQQQKGKKKNK